MSNEDFLLQVGQIVKDGNFIHDGKVYLVVCPKCKKENYAMNVTLGICTWCGFSYEKQPKPTQQPLKQ